MSHCTKSEKKVIYNYFFIAIIFKNLLKIGFKEKFTLTICFGCVWIVIGYFFFEKQTFNGLRVIAIQNIFLCKILNTLKSN